MYSIFLYDNCWNYSPRARWAVRIPGLHFDGCAGMRHLAHVTYHQRHPLVVLQLTNGLVVRYVEKRLAIDLQYFVPDHKAGTVCHTILVHAGDKDSQTVFDAAAYHQPQRLARLDEQLDATYAVRGEGGNRYISVSM